MCAADHAMPGAAFRGGQRGGPARGLALHVALSLVPMVSGLATASGDSPPPLGRDNARQLLERSGQGMLWPALENDTSLLAFAMSEQAKLPSPPGAHIDGIKVVSEDPHILIMDEFLSETECEYLQAIGKPRLQPAKVVKDGDQWFDTQAEVRNNEQIWLNAAEERGVPLLRHIFKRIHRTVRVPDEFTEALQIGRYSVSQKYEGHVDTDPRNGVGRPATLLIYLNDVEEGGDTLFPVGRDDCGRGWRVHPDTGEKLYGSAFCCETPQLDRPQSVRVHPKRGRAVLFFNHRPTGTVDKSTLHIGCPVRKGEKWIAQRWLRHEPYNKVSYTDGDGWDPRFDGVPHTEERPTERHLRSVSHRDPRIYMVERFLSRAEVDWLSGLTKGHAPSVSQPFEEWYFSEPEYGKDPKLLAILARLRGLALLPPGYHPVSKIMHWRAGEAERPYLYTEHATVIRVVLTSATQGGEIYFPRSGDPKDSYACSGSMASCCTGTGVKVRGQPGDAVILYTSSMDGNVDTRTEHATCPVLAGDSWVAEFRYNFPINWPPSEGHKPAGVVTRLSIQFVNVLASNAWLFWVDPRSASEVPMGPVPPGDAKTFNSYEGHRWHVRDREAGGEVMHVFDISSEVQQRFLIGGDESDPVRPPEL